MEDEIDFIISELREAIDPVERRVAPAYIDVASEICELLLADQWQDRNTEILERIARKIDVLGHIRTEYTEDWKKKTNKKLGDPWLGVLAALLAKKLCLQTNSGDDPGAQLKTLNVLFKCLDVLSAEQLANRNILAQFAAQQMARLSAQLPVMIDSEHTSDKQEPIGNIDHPDLREIDLTVLFYEGPIARAYLETIRSLGLKPRRIINLIAAKDIATHRTVGRFLPASMRPHFAASIQRRKIHHWPRQIQIKHPGLAVAMRNEISARLGFASESLERAAALNDVSTYSNNVENLLIDGLGDPELLSLLSSNVGSAILYTGGGIVPARLLSVPDLKMIHVHPGYLPALRGADCLLWSSLVAGRTSASLFYMSPGIDEGDIVQARWLPRVTFDGYDHGLSPQMLYRAVYGYFDPWVRSFVLRETLASQNDYLTMPSLGQSETSGTTYHFMHGKMREMALDSLFGAH